MQEALTGSPAFPGAASVPLESVAGAVPWTCGWAPPDPVASATATGTDAVRRPTKMSGDAPATTHAAVVPARRAANVILKVFMMNSGSILFSGRAEGTPAPITPAYTAIGFFPQMEAAASIDTPLIPCIPPALTQTEQSVRNPL